MTCHDARELFSARADDALSAAEHAELQAHLATCADCQREWVRFEQTVALLHAIEPAHAPAGFVDRVVAARPRPWYARLARGLFVPWPVKLPLEAAAVLLVAGLAIVIVQHSPELQQASHVDEVGTRVEAPPRVEDPPTPARETPAPSTTALTGERVAPTPDAASELSIRRPGAASPFTAGSAPESRQDIRELERQLRARDQSAKATESPRDPTQNLFGVGAKKVDEPPAVLRKETEPFQELEPGGKVGGVTLAPSTSPPATAAPPERRATTQGFVPASAGLQARLAVGDRATAEATVRDLVTRAAGRVVSQSAPAQADGGATTLVLLVPADRWDELRRGLEALGTLRVTGQKTEDAGQLLITLRLER